MRKIVLKRCPAFLLALLLLLPVFSTGSAAAASKKELRGVWVASVYNLDYPAKSTTDPAALKAEADSILENCANLGLNAVFLQVRPACDALYPSSLFPWSQYLTGKQGTAPAGGFDPLAYWVSRAHALGLELHAWINPFRVAKGGDAAWNRLSPQNPAVRNPDWVVRHEDSFYLNPGLPEVRELVVQGAEELVSRYEVDGVHLDDYFYPGADFRDNDAYAKFGRGFSNVGDWRRDNINQLVQTLDRRLHRISPSLSFGISPSGVWADKSSLPEGSNTTGGYESYYETYADSRKWVKQGWVDYICPQIYWEIGHPSMDYATIARWWADTVRGTGVKLYTGMADYKAGDSSPSSPWHGAAAMQKQLELNAGLSGVSGEVHFRYRLIRGSGALTALYRSQYGGKRLALNTLEHNGYLTGDNGKCRPDSPLSRAESVTLLARLSLEPDGSPPDTGTAAWSPFRDVTGREWHGPAVAFGERYGIVGGYPDGTFRPGKAVTRAEWITLIAAYFQVGAGVSGQRFPDVSPSHWAAPQISYAVEQGWAGGYPDGTFRPDQAVTRAEAVTILNHALGRQADGQFLVSGGIASPFPDLSPSHWAYQAILEAALSHDYRRGDSGEIWIGIR